MCRAAWGKNPAQLAGSCSDMHPCTKSVPSFVEQTSCLLCAQRTAVQVTLSNRHDRPGPGRAPVLLAERREQVARGLLARVGAPGHVGAGLRVVLQQVVQDGEPDLLHARALEDLLARGGIRDEELVLMRAVGRGLDARAPDVQLQALQRRNLPRRSCPALSLHLPPHTACL
jgi:hypothetical protein